MPPSSSRPPWRRLCCRRRLRNISPAPTSTSEKPACPAAARTRNRVERLSTSAAAARSPGSMTERSISSARARTSYRVVGILREPLSYLEHVLKPDEMMQGVRASEEHGRQLLRGTRGAVAADHPGAAAGATQAARGPAARARPRRPRGHTLPSAYGVSMEGAAPRVRLRLDLPSADAAVAPAGRVPTGLRRAGALLSQEARPATAVDFPRQRHGEGARRGAIPVRTRRTGANSG